MATPTISSPFIRRNSEAWQDLEQSLASWTDVESVDIKFTVAGTPTIVGIYVPKDGTMFYYSSVSSGVYTFNLRKKLSAGAHGSATSNAVILFAVADTEGDLHTQGGNFNITYADVEPVLHVYNIINDNWNAGNVTKPTLVIAGDGSDPVDMEDVDYIKFYESPRADVRDFRMIGQTHRDAEDFVILDVHTSDESTGTRAQMNLLMTEIERVLNSVRNEPGGGYTILTYGEINIKAEYSDHCRKTLEARLRRTLLAVDT